MDSNGFVVGITTAVVSGSQGVGFAIPSDTIIESPYLISSGSYNLHSYLGIGGVDMSYQFANASGTTFTYGVPIESVIPGGPAASAGLRAGTTTVTVDGTPYSVGGDIIVSINGTKIINNDALASYLVESHDSGSDYSRGYHKKWSLDERERCARDSPTAELVDAR